MIYLLLDSSTTYLSVGLVKDNKLIKKTSYPCFQQQSEFMVEEIAKLLKASKVPVKKINAVVLILELELL